MLRRNNNRWAIVALFLLSISISIIGLIRHTLTTVSLRMMIRPYLRAEDLQLSDGGKLVYFPTRDGCRLGGVLYPSTQTNSTPIIICHGNMQTVRSVLPLARCLHREGFTVLAFDYRGFGLSRGRMASFNDLTQDLQAGIEYVVQLPRVNKKHIGLIGLSLGTAPVAKVGATDPRIQRMVLHAPIYSGQRMVYNFIPTRLGAFCGRFLIDVSGLNTSNAVSRIRCPLLIIQEENDVVTPISNGKGLYKIAKRPKKLWVVPKESHLGALPTYEYIMTVVSFFKQEFQSKATLVDEHQKSL